MKKKEFAELVFCAIEKGDTEKVKELCNAYPEFKNKIFDRNGWSPVMYACRYGNLDLLKYFQVNEYTLEMQNAYGLMHIASFSGELKILKYLIEVMNMNPNPTGVESTPLRFACKYQHYDCIEYLFHKGAYLIDENYIHNLCPYRTQETKDNSTYEVVKYKTLTGVDVPNNMLFRVNDIRDDKTKNFLRWIRNKNFAFVCYAAQKPENRTNPKLKIFQTVHRKAIANFL